MYIKDANDLALQFKEVTDKEILLGISKIRICNADHFGVVHDFLENDICIYFPHPAYGVGHLNKRQFEEWCKINRPNLFDRLYKLKAFW